MEIINPYQREDFISIKNKLKETNCCTVVSLWVATGFTRDIETCFHYMYKHGRKYRDGMPLSKIRSALFSMKSFKVREGPYTSQNRICLSQFIKKHPIGTFYVMNRTHAWVVKDGMVYDHTVKPKRQILAAFRIYPIDNRTRIE